MTKEYVGVAQCPRCNQWQSFHTDNPASYQYTCRHCQHTKTLKDQQRSGGFNLSVEFINGSVQDASLVAQSLNKRNAPRIQSVLQEELKKPPHKQRDIPSLIEDIEPRVGFNTITP